MSWALMGDAWHAVVAGGWLTAFARAAAPVAIAALWQGAAIALFPGLGLRFGRRIGAAQRFAVWATAFAVVAGLPMLALLERGAAAGMAAKTPVGALAPRLWFEFDDRWAVAIAGLWAAAALARAVGLAVHALRLRRIWNTATPVLVDARLRALLADSSSARRGGLRKPAELCTTCTLDRPCVIGFLAPRILIPEWLFERMTAEELEQVVLHETEHLRRGDDWTNLLQKLALVVFPLNPALAWIEGRLCREREMACDEGVVRRTQAPRAYAACLTSLAERRLELRMERRRAHALSLGAFERRPELVRRVYSILARKQALHPVAARAIVGFAGCGLLIASFELASCPQMVAFVPAARVAAVDHRGTRTTAAAPQDDEDRAYAEPTVARSDSGFRVVETRAIVPPRRGVAPMNAAVSRPNAAQPDEPAVMAQREPAVTTNSAPREVLLRAEMPEAEGGASGRGTDSSFAGQPAYVVVTTWEVRTTRRNAGLVSDYDPDASAQPLTDTSQRQSTRQTDDRGTTQITVTRMVFAVYTVAVRPEAEGSVTKPATTEKSNLPPAPQPGSGWLDLQL